MQIILYDPEEEYEVDKIDLSSYDLYSDGDKLLALLIDIIEEYLDSIE